MPDPVYSFDASSMIHAWDNYPIENPLFESLWDWMGEKVQSQEFVISKIAFDEVAHKIPDGGLWLKDNNVNIFELTAQALYVAQNIKSILSIDEENYTKGVGENDLFIVSIAKDNDLILISEEGRQSILPALKSNYKIPAVCDLSQVNVQCINFINLLK